MYIGISYENFVTIGVMLLLWMITIHLLAQVGLNLADYVPGLGG